MPFQKVLVAVDSDPVAVKAAEVGVELATALAAELALISVADRGLADAAVPEMPRDELLTDAREHARQVIADLAPKLAPGTTTLTFMPEGEPAEQIVKTAEAWQADLVVIGSHGRGALGRMLLGSVAEAVMRRAPCPVLVVRGKV